MDTVLGTWLIDSRAKYANAEQRVKSGYKWTIQYDEAGKQFKADWYLKDTLKSGKILDIIPSDQKSFVIRDSNDKYTVRAWLITKDLLLGIATSYDATDAAGDSPSCPDPGDNDVDVFVAMRGVGNY